MSLRLARPIKDVHNAGFGYKGFGLLSSTSEKERAS